MSELKKKDPIFDHIPAFGTRLAELREQAIRHHVTPENEVSVKGAVDAFAKGIIAELKAPIGAARWVLMEYVPEVKDGDLIEHTTYVETHNLLNDYWNKVNS